MSPYDIQVYIIMGFHFVLLPLISFMLYNWNGGDIDE